MAVELKNFGGIQHAKGTRTHGGISVTNTANGMRVKLSQALMQSAFLDDLWVEGENPTVQIMISSEELIIGRDISPEASTFRLGGKKNAPIIYSTALGEAILERAGCELERNKTRSFGDIRVDTLPNGETVAVIRLI